MEEAVHDKDRVEYFKGYTQALLEAINVDGVNVKGYFAWSKFFLTQANGRLTMIHWQVFWTTSSGRTVIKPDLVSHLSTIRRR